MRDVDKAVRKFQSAPGPIVVMTPAEHLALCEHYGAIRPDDYENPFMGKTIQIREHEFTDTFELPIDTFLPQEEAPDPFIVPLADALDEVTRPFEDTDDPDAEIPEDAYA